MPNPNIWKPDFGFKALVAHSNTFCLTVGAYTVVNNQNVYNPTTAMQHIFGNVDDDFDEARACVSVDSMVRKNVGIGNWKSDGTIHVLLERKYPEFEIGDKTTYDSQEEQFTQWCSDIWYDIEAKLESRTVLTVNGTDYNPLAVHQVRSDGKAMLIPASECPQYDDADFATPSARKARSWWWMQFFVELY